jgi:hypothetical protein
MGVRSRVGLAGALLALCGAVSCGDASQDSQGAEGSQGAPPYDEVRAEFAAFLSTHDSCAASDECVLISPGCPLGCFQAVNAEHMSLVETKARELIAAFESDGLSCVYKCVAPKGAVCSNGRCVRGSDLDTDDSGVSDASP